jgi:WbqC-like protein family
MGRSIVISQSMYFPWVGLLEQMRLADTFVYYDTVAFDRGFYNRVQVKAEQGSRWITVPLSDHRRGQPIDEIRIDKTQNWQKQHIGILRQAYRSAPFRGEMLDLVDSVISAPAETLGQVSRASMLAVADYFDLRSSRDFVDARTLNVEGGRSQRLLDMVLALHGTKYITGHGARNYLDHALFENAGIAVEYMRYECIPYPQLYGPFTPYVTSLDLIANCGKPGSAVIRSTAVDWRQFVNAPA